MFLISLALSLVAGLSTGLGALVVLAFGIPRAATVGNMLSFAAGVMIYLAVFDMVPEVLEFLDGYTTLLFFLLGCVVFGAIAYLVPDIDAEWLMRRRETTMTQPSSSSSTSLSSPQVPISSALHSAPATKQLLRTSLLIFTGLSLHNLPEGMAVYLSSVRGLEAGRGMIPGLRLAFAIALHNIPEGIALACPIFAATRSQLAAVKWSLISGLCEPAGAVLAGSILSYVMDARGLNCVLALVAGMMATISVAELAPTALKYTTRMHAGGWMCVGGAVVYIGSSLLDNLMHT